MVQRPRRNVFHGVGAFALPLTLMALFLASACDAQGQAGGSAKFTAQQRIGSWTNGAPGAVGSTPGDQSRLCAFPAPKKPGFDTHTAILVIPGGGYVNYSLEDEGLDAARWLSNLGVSAFILQYRLAPRYSYPAQLDGGIRAMRWMRQHAVEFDVNPHRIGVWGSSARAHLASTLATRFDSGNPSAKDSIEQVSSRPAFLNLVYPAIEPLGFGAAASLKSLAESNPSLESADVVMTNKHVTPETPLTFVLRADDDNAVYPESSIRFYLALRSAGVPAELHIYQHCGHGFGLALFDPVLKSWVARLADWLRGLGVFNTHWLSSVF